MLLLRVRRLRIWLLSVGVYGCHCSPANDYQADLTTAIDLNDWMKFVRQIQIELRDSIHGRRSATHRARLQTLAVVDLLALLLDAGLVIGAERSADAICEPGQHGFGQCLALLGNQSSAESGAAIFADDVALDWHVNHAAVFADAADVRAAHHCPLRRQVAHCIEQEEAFAHVG